MEDNEQAAAPAAAEQTNPATPPVPGPEQAAAQPEGNQPPAEGDEDEGDEGNDPADAPKRQSRAARYKATIARQQAEIEALRRSPARPVPTKSAAELAGPRPHPSQYATVADYQAAASGWEAKRQFIDLDIQNRRADQQASAALEQESRARAYAEKQEDARAALPDYDTVVGAARMAVSDPVAEALMESEHTARLEYHLAKNPKTLAELNRMSPKQAALAVGRLEAVLTAQPAKRSTQAPPPPSALKGGTAGPVKSLSDLARNENAGDYIAARRAELAKQRA